MLKACSQSHCLEIEEKSKHVFSTALNGRTKVACRFGQLGRVTSEEDAVNRGVVSVKEVNSTLSAPRLSVYSFPLSSFPPLMLSSAFLPLSLLSPLIYHACFFFPSHLLLSLLSSVFLPLFLLFYVLLSSSVEQ